MKLKGLLVILKGMAMGAADVVPGVSGGTIAFITGIYEELIESLKSLNFRAIQILFKEGLKSFWSYINGSFLVKVFAGIFISVLSLAKLISYLLDNHPILIWAFFFGLILASIFLIAREVKEWKMRSYIAIVVGSVVSYYITIATPSESPDSYLFLFLAGFLAIIAMILPGISGAFILLLMGAYGTVIGTINDFREGLSDFNSEVILMNGSKLGIFALGCVGGLMAFSRVLSWMFKHHKNTTLALLTGFMIGSLNKVWPWKTTIMSRIAHEGKANEAVVPFIQDNVFPWNYGNLNEIELGLSIVPGTDAKLLPALILMILGIMLIIVMYRFAPDDE